MVVFVLHDVKSFQTRVLEMRMLGIRGIQSSCCFACLAVHFLAFPFLFLCCVGIRVQISCYTVPNLALAYRLM